MDGLKTFGSTPTTYLPLMSTFDFPIRTLNHGRRSRKNFSQIVRSLPKPIVLKATRKTMLQSSILRGLT